MEVNFSFQTLMLKPIKQFIDSFFLIRHYRKNGKRNSTDLENNRKKKMSIEGISIIGDKSAMKNSPTPVCIAIEEKPKQLYVKLSPEITDCSNARSSKSDTVRIYKANGTINSVALVG